MTSHIAENSVLVAAHPDDEILWFPSVLQAVKKIVFCYIECPSNPQLGIGRQQVIAKYPQSNVASLNIAESGAFNQMDWDKPEITDYGAKLKQNNRFARNYKNNFYQLREMLMEILKDYNQVITHNPWGEYGHEEHVQIYQAIKSIQPKLDFDILFSSYFSNKSFNLLSMYLNRLCVDPVKNPIDKNLTDSIKLLYEKNHCWTWYKDWKWEDEDTLIRDVDADYERGISGSRLPLTLIKVKPQRVRKTSFLSFIKPKRKT